MHAARAPGLRVQRALKGRAEDGGANTRPVKTLRRLQQQIKSNLIGKLRDHNVVVAEQPAVHIGKGQ